MANLLEPEPQLLNPWPQVYPAEFGTPTVCATVALVQVDLESAVAQPAQVALISLKLVYPTERHNLTK